MPTRVSNLREKSQPAGAASARLESVTCAEDYV